jgi:hypothetical protein
MVVLEAAILVVLLLFTAAAKLLLSLPLTEEGVLVPTCKGCLGGGGAILLLLAASGFDCAYAPATAFWVILPSICLTGTTFSCERGWTKRKREEKRTKAIKTNNTATYIHVSQWSMIKERVFE